jgi:hypothetical protein
MPTIQLPIEIITPKQLYPPAHKCIYCGATPPRLNEEHIVPFAIAGDLAVLPESSCDCCTNITGRFEQRCLRDMLASFRVKVGLPSRTRRSKRRTVFPVRVLSGQEQQRIEISGNDLPLLYPAFTFPVASLLSGRPAGANVDINISFHYVQEEVVEFSKRHSAWETPNVYPVDFARMLAKIAHAYVASELTLDGFSPLLDRMIIDDNGTVGELLNFVGTDTETPPATSDLLTIGWQKNIYESGNKLVITTIRLFPFLGTPVYHVVTGKWES